MSSHRSTFLSGLAGVLAGALLIGAGPSLAAVVGDALRLGQSNSVSKQTTLESAGKHVLSLHNSGSGRGLRITTAKGKPPFTVNRTTRVQNLNADNLDGYSASEIVGLATATAAAETNTTAIGYVDVPDTSLTVDVPDHRNQVALVTFTAENRCNQDPLGNAYCFVGLTIDGDSPREAVLNSIRQGANSTTGALNAWASHSFQWVVTLGPGTHTLAIQYRVDEANASFAFATRTLSVLTVPKKNASTT